MGEKCSVLMESAKCGISDSDCSIQIIVGVGNLDALLLLYFVVYVLFVQVPVVIYLTTCV